MIVIYTQDGTYIRSDADSARDVLIAVYGEKIGAEAHAAVKRCAVRHILPEVWRSAC